MKCVPEILFLMVFAETILSDSSFDTSEWNSFTAIESQENIDVVDPSGWNYDRETKNSLRSEEENFQPNSMIENESEVSRKVRIEALVNQMQTKKESMAFAKRFVSILLESAGLSQKTVNGQDVSGFIEIKISAKHFKILKHFSNSIVNVSMRDLDSILASSIHGAHMPTFDISELIDKLFFMGCQKEVWLPFFLIFIMVVAVKQIKSGKSVAQVVKTFLLLILIASFMVEYYRMYKDVEIQQRIVLEKHKDVPSSCNPENRSFWSACWNTFSYFFSVKDDECEKYYKAAYLDPMLEITPVRVLSSLLSDFFLYPSGKIGTAIVSFTSAIIGGLPFPYNWIVWIGSSIASFLIIIWILTLLIGGSIRFYSWFGGVGATRNPTSVTATPHSQPTVTAPPTPPLPLANKTHPVLQAVTEMNNLVIMDANSLGTLMLRAQSNVSLQPSGVQELNDFSQSALPSRPSVEKIDLTRVQKERSLLNIGSSHPSCSKCSNVGEVEEKTSNENLNRNIQENNDSKSDSAGIQEELLGSYEVIQSDETVSLLETDIVKNESECEEVGRSSKETKNEVSFF